MAVNVVNIADELSRLPAQPLTAVRVLRMVDGEDASAIELGRLVEVDPALSARVLRLVNSPFFGLKAKVNSASRAVVLLGFSTVQAIAAGAACGLLGEDADLGPPNFWAHSVAVATASGVAAAVTGVAHADAVSVGLLHDIGVGLLHRVDTAFYADYATSGQTDLEHAEKAHYGMSHAEAGARALEVWQFPRGFVDAVREHHKVSAFSEALSQTVALGHAVAETIEALSPDEPHRSVEECLDVLGLSSSYTSTLLTEAGKEINRVAEFLSLGL